jgi:hypothetical protein
MDSKENLLNGKVNVNAAPESHQGSIDQKQLLYFDHARIRHMERMFDLFITLFKRG